MRVCKNGAVLRAMCVVTVGHTASTMGEIRRVRVSEMLIVVGTVVDDLCLGARPDVVITPLSLRTSTRRASAEL